MTVDNDGLPFPDRSPMRFLLPVTRCASLPTRLPVPSRIREEARARFPILEGEVPEASPVCAPGAEGIGLSHDLWVSETAIVTEGLREEVSER